VFQATIAALEGFVTVQISGPRWNTKNNTTLGLDKDHYNETYMQMQTITRDVPTLRADWGLYFILALQPVVTVLALLAVLLLFPTPISRGFGLVSLLEGVDKDSLDILKGAGFSGELKDPVGVGIKVSRSDAEARGNTISYFMDGSGSKGGIRRGEIYQ